MKLLVTTIFLFLTAATLPAADSLFVNEFPDYRVFQRKIGTHSCMIEVTGRASGKSLKKIEARIVKSGTEIALMPWKPVDRAGTNGGFKWGMTIPEGGWYSIQARAVGRRNVVVRIFKGTAKFGVGAGILCIGQSNMVGYGIPRQFTEADSMAVCFSNSGYWEHLKDPYDDRPNNWDIDAARWEGKDWGSSQAGSMIPSLANALVSRFRIPFYFVPCARGATPLHGAADSICWVYRNPENHADTGTLYGKSINRARKAGGVEMLLMFQGEKDAEYGYPRRVYEEDLKKMLSQYREDLYDSIPLFYCQIGRTTADEGNFDEYMSGIRSAQAALDDGKNFLMGLSAVDLAIQGGWHYYKTGYDTLGKRMAQAIAFRYGKGSSYRGPWLGSASFGAKNDTVFVTVNHRGGTDFTPDTGIGGFSVVDKTAEFKIVSASRSSAGKIKLVLACAASGKARLRYLYGKNAFGTNVSDAKDAVHDNSNLGLPLEPTVNDLEIKPAEE